MRFSTQRMSLDAHTMPNSLQSWLGQELEMRGIDAVIYTRYILSILQRDSIELDYIDLYADDLPKKERKFKGKGRKKGKSSKSHGQSIDCEERKKTAAVECLLSVTDEDSGIEDLVEELCVKLKKLNTDKENGGKSSPRRKRTVSKSSSPGDATRKYYAAFPSLTTNNNVIEAPPAVSCQSPSVWQSRILKVNEISTPPPLPQPHKDKNHQREPPSDTTTKEPKQQNSNNPRSSGDGNRKDNNPPRYGGRGSKEKPTYRRSKESNRQHCYGGTSRKKETNYQHKHERSSSPHNNNNITDKKSSGHIIELGRPTFIIPRAPVTNKSPSNYQPEVIEQQMSLLRDSIDRRLTEKKISKINEPSAFSHFSKPFPKVRHSSQASVEEVEVDTWYTEPLDTLYSTSPLPREPLYLRRPSSETDFIHTPSHQPVLHCSSLPITSQENIKQHMLWNAMSHDDTVDSTVLVSGILERYYNSDNEEDAIQEADVTFALNYSPDLLGAPLLYNEEHNETDVVFDPTTPDDTLKLIELLKDLKNELTPPTQGCCTSALNSPTDCPSQPETSRFLSMFRNETEVPADSDSNLITQEEPFMPCLVETVSSEEYGSSCPWQSGHSSTLTMWPAVFPTLLETWSYSFPPPTPFWNSGETCFMTPFSFQPMDWQSLLNAQSLRHLWDVNLVIARPGITEFSPLNLAGLLGTSPPAPQGLLKICESLDYSNISLWPSTQSPHAPHLHNNVSSRGLWDDTHWGMFTHNSAEDIHSFMKTSISTDSFFLHSNQLSNKTCKVKLLYRQRSWSFDDGLCARADVLTSVYSSPRTQAFIDGMQPENLHEDLLFSPETHFRPIQTPFSCSPDDDKLLNSNVPDGYQKFNHDNKANEFIPKFRLQNDMEKSAQTDINTPLLEEVNDVGDEEPLNRECSPGFDVLTYFSDQDSDGNEPLQFSLDLDNADQSESDLGILAETLTQNTINKLMEDESVDVESELDCTGRAPSLSQSKFARLWKNAAPYTIMASNRPSKIPGCSSNSDMRNLAKEDLSDEVVQSGEPVKDICEDHALMGPSPNVIEDCVDAAACCINRNSGECCEVASNYSTKLENPLISALWKGEDVVGSSTRLASPRSGLQRANSIWSVGSESDNDVTVLPLWLHNISDAAFEEHSHCTCDEEGCEGETEVDDNPGYLETSASSAVVYVSELERKWLESEDLDTGQATKRDTRESEPKKKLCSFFKDGHCKKSDCKFAHDAQHVTCRYWQQGNCFKGITCPFLHGYHSVRVESPKNPVNDTSQTAPTKGQTSASGGRRIRRVRSSPRRMNHPSYRIHRSGARRKLFKSNMDDVSAAKK